MEGTTEESSKQKTTSSPDEKAKDAASIRSQSLEQARLQQKKLEKWVVSGTILFVSVIGGLMWFSVGSASSEQGIISCSTGKHKGSRECGDKKAKEEQEWKSVTKGNSGGDNFSFSLGN